MPKQSRADAETPTRIKNPELVKQRRRQIVEAATPLFVKHGFHKTTTRQIAETVGGLPVLDEGLSNLLANNISVLGHMWIFRRWHLKKHYAIEEYIKIQTDFILGIFNRRA